MTTSKRKRRVILVRTIPVADSPEFRKKLKVSLLETYKNQQETHLRIMSSLHLLIKDSSSEVHQKLDRGILIECITILDENIGQALHHFQLRILKREPDQTIDYQDAEDELKACLPKSVPSQFQSQRSIIRNFRSLRHQFAHRSSRAFSFLANKDNFESFLRKLDGITLGESFHVLINGKAGVLIPYQITSDKFLPRFYSESVAFLSMLLGILFPTDEKTT